MKSTKLFSCLTLLFLLLACEKDDSTIIELSSGTSFGECMGYCMRELIISDAHATYSASSWDSQNFPTLEFEWTLSSDQWNNLTALANLGDLQEYDDIIGCPDCADGGAEWVKMETSEGSKMITFEYGESLEDIQNLIDEMRILHSHGETSLFLEE